MSSIVQELFKKNLITPSSFVRDTQYEVIMGSYAYGVSQDTSDFDIYGFCVPKKNIIFPHLAGYIHNFGSKPESFEQFQQHHIFDKEKNRSYDLQIYNIVRFVSLCMDNNPNMIDSLFVPLRCIKHVTKIGHMIRDERKMFLHKGAWHKFKGYAHSQLNKIKNKLYIHYLDLCKELKVDEFFEVDELISVGVKNKILEIIAKNTLSDEQISTLYEKTKLKDLQPEIIVRLLNIRQELDKNLPSKRRDMIRKFGYDVKFAYHVIRLIHEIEQILVEGDLDLERNREQLKSIRRGEWPLEYLEEYFFKKEIELESLYLTSKLQHSPDEEKIKDLLLKCLEEYFGNIDKGIKQDQKLYNALVQISKITNSVI